ncbi:phage tail protein [Arthrobacter sp. ok909]|uniref:phage tail protein n=1 Tax=Arthrobacter sp. ok909 TaxID=1761746 RepID=UPI0011145B69|nr:phage tail protein [Arthrobacter sp. ok909]
MLADLSGRSKSRQIILSRNEADDVSWTLDLNDFENYCRLAHVNPASLLVPNSTEVRVRRGKTYLCGAKLLYRNITVTPDEQYIELKATGFLNLFKKRYTAASRIFAATQATTIAATLITESQAQGANWDFGVTIGTLATVGVHDRTYLDDEIKDSIQKLTKVQVAPFDFEFTYNKVFNTYAAIGSQRPELVFEYPGNIRSFRLPLDGTMTANHIRVLGSGSGTDGSARVTVDDTNSQINYKVLEDKLLESSTIDTATLTEQGNAELAAVATPFEIPTISVNGNVAPFVTDYHIGDYVTVKIGGYGLTSNINAMYRIERIDLSIDENDNEDVRLYLSR